MLTIKNLSIYNYKYDRVLFKDFSFTLNPKDKVGLIGEEGNGKSTLLKAITKDPQLLKNFQVIGEISGNDVVGYLPQIFPSDFKGLSIKDLLKITSSDFDYNLYYRLLSKLDISEELINNNKDFSNLSGGEKTKIQLLLILMEEPDVLLLDEPTNDLDIVAIDWMVDFIKNTDLPVIYVSHDENLLEKTTNRIIHLEQLMRKKEGKITLSNLNFKDYIDFRSNSLNLQEKRANKEEEIFSKKMDRYRRIYSSVENALGKVSRSSPGEGKNLKDKMHTVKSMGKRLEKEKENLTKRPDYEEAIFFDFLYNTNIHKSKEILDLSLDRLEVEGRLLSKNIRLEVFGPEKVGIIGENGSGKTTLLKIIKSNLEDRGFKVFYMPQNYEEVMDLSLSPVDFLKRDFTKEEEVKIRTYLGAMKFTSDEMNHKLDNLSGGQRAKIFFTKMVIEEAEVLLLDEPTRNLSPLSSPVIRQAIKNFSGLVIGVSHDRAFINSVFNKVYRITSQGLEKIK